MTPTLRAGYSWLELGIAVVRHSLLEIGRETVLEHEHLLGQAGSEAEGEMLQLTLWIEDEVGAPERRQRDHKQGRKKASTQQKVRHEEMTTHSGCITAYCENRSFALENCADSDSHAFDKASLWS